MQHLRHRHRPRSLPARAMGLFGAMLLTTLCGCQQQAPIDPALRQPVVSFDGPSLRRLLGRVARLEGTPLGIASAQILERIDACQEVFVHARPDNETSDEPAPLSANAFGCQADAEASDSSLARFARLRRGQNHGLVLWPLGADGRIELRLDVDDQGGVDLDGTLVPDPQFGVGSLMIPSAQAPAPAAIAADGVLAHLRMRSRDGLQLSDWIESGSQADQLFALKGRLLEGALLEDSWELAVLPPTAQGSRPLLAGALHHRLAGPVRLAVDELLSQLEATWPIQRSSRNFLDESGQTLEGACFLELPLLPELAPCWVVTEKALLIGDQPAALERALRGIESKGPETVAKETASATTSELRIFFDRIHAADRQLAPNDPQTRMSDLWTTLRLDARARDENTVELEARLGARS